MNCRPALCLLSVAKQLALEAALEAVLVAEAALWVAMGGAQRATAQISLHSHSGGTLYAEQYTTYVSRALRMVATTSG